MYLKVLDSIAAGNNVTLTVIVHVTAEGTIANNVTAKSDENDTNVTNETPEVTVNPDVRLNVTKVVYGGVTEVYVGDSIVYVITVTNNGNSTATNVNVTEKLSGLVVVTGADVDVGSWSDVTNVWTIPSLAGNGAKAILTLTVKVVGNGTVANAVVANSTENTTDVPANSTNVTAKPDVRLSIDKVITSDVRDVHVGDSIVYEITVTNNGNSTATGVNVTEFLSDIVVVTGAVGPGTWNNTTGIWHVGSIAANGGSAKLTLTVRVMNTGTVKNNVSTNSNENKTLVNATAPNVPVGADVKLFLLVLMLN